MSQNSFMTTTIYPLTFTPVLKDYIWGGRNLETKFGRRLPPGIVAESWEISGHHSSATAVNNGPLAGKTLPDVLTLLGLDLVGTRSEAMLKRGKFPVIIKLLDANKPLSVQVHPKDDYANAHENGELGKTEMWYILHAEPGAELIYGLKPNVSPQTFRQNLEAGTLESCLHYLPVQPGDAIFIPAGSIHALMDGILLTEVLQNSDTTYRVYDWNRVGADGKPRPLHIDKAMDVTNFDQVEPGPYPVELLAENSHFRRERITACSYFNVETFTFEENGTFKGTCNGSTFEIWGVVSGHGQVNWAGQPVELPAIRFVLLPAALGQFEIKAAAPTTCLRIYVPEQT